MRFVTRIALLMTCFVACRCSGDDDVDECAGDPHSNATSGTDSGGAGGSAAGAGGSAGEGSGDDASSDANSGGTGGSETSTGGSRAEGAASGGSSDASTGGSGGEGAASGASSGANSGGSSGEGASSGSNSGGSAGTATTAGGSGGESSSGFDVFVDGALARGLDIGVNTSEGVTDWVDVDGEVMTMTYPDDQMWGAVFVFVTDETVDASGYEQLSLEMRGETGDELVAIGIKDSNDPDDGSEAKFEATLTPEWQTYTYELTDFESATLNDLEVLVEFVFDSGGARTVQARNIRYLPAGAEQ